MVVNNKYEKIKELIDNASRITILSGAGVSVASGIPDFRSRGGLYDGNNAEVVLSRSNYFWDKEKFWTDYKNIFGEKLLSKNLEPCEGHKFVKYLKDMGKDVVVITQNVDGLYHKVEGLTDEDIIEYHGNATGALCKRCDTRYSSEYVMSNDVPRCSSELPEGGTCDTILDVDVVLFGDEVRYKSEAQSRVEVSDIIIVMGTSLQVYPFSNLLTNNKNRKNVLINLNDIPKKRFEVKILSDIEEVVTDLMKLYN